MAVSGVILAAARLARRRILYNRLLSQLALVACLAMGLVVLLLVAGTQVFDWPWLVAVSLACGAVGIYRALRRLPGEYESAQRLDHAAALRDSLSTAIFFATVDRQADARICVSQQAMAERLAQSVDVRAAIPFTVPRSAYALAALTLVASSLFALRFGIEKRMDLRPPLAHVLLPWLGISGRHPLEARDSRKNPQDRRPAEESADGQKSVPPDAPPLEGVDVSGVENAKSSAQLSQEKLEPNTDSLEQQADGTEGSEAPEGAASDQASRKQNRNDEGGTDRKPTNAPADSTLMSKLRDAMQNLMSRLKQPPAAGGTPQASKNGQQQTRSAQQKASGEGNSQKGQSQADANGQEAQEGQNGQQAGESETAQRRNSSPGGEDSSRNPSSGIGKQDGNKDPRLAEQLAAMGKISEIIGKRAANISGEVTVEVRNSSQQLRTAYSGADSQHGDRGGEMHRDEVPVALQHYVQQYFSEVRKQARP